MYKSDWIRELCVEVSLAFKHCKAERSQVAPNSDVTSQFNVSVKNLKEEVKFLKYIGSSECPKGMETIRVNLIQSMMLENEVKSNQGSKHAVVDPLRSVLRYVETRLPDLSDAALQPKTKLEDNKPALEDAIAAEKSLHEDQM